MNKTVPVFLFIIIVSCLFIYEAGLNDPLGAPDGKNQFNYAQYEKCDSGYANGICWITKSFHSNPQLFWLLFFIIGAIILPLTLYFFYRNAWILPSYFVFTGFFWNVEVMQTYGQLLLSILFVYFLFEKDQKRKAIVLILLAVSLLLGFEIHNMELFLIIGVIIIELLIHYSHKIKAWMFCGTLPVDLFSQAENASGEIRNSLNNKSQSIVQFIYYYAFHFFVEGMLFLFSFPAILYILQTKQIRFIFYFCFVLFSALGVWALMRFDIWHVTRILLWIPLVLIVPFCEWLTKQKKETKYLWIIFGLIYFAWNIYWFVLRKTDLNC